MQEQLLELQSEIVEALEELRWLIMAGWSQADSQSRHSWEDLLYLIRDAKLQADRICLTEANKKYRKTLIAELERAEDIAEALRADEED